MVLKDLFRKHFISSVIVIFFHKKAEEKDELLKDLQEKEEQLNTQTQAKMELANKIKAMESKLLTGGKNIVDHTNEQEKALEDKR